MNWLQTAVSFLVKEAVSYKVFITKTDFGWVCVKEISGETHYLNTEGKFVQAELSRGIL